MTSNDCCRRTSRYSDVAHRVKHVFQMGLDEARRTGICPLRCTMFYSRGGVDSRWAPDTSKDSGQCCKA
eukprot:7856158-Pyramimonas_sp.AAC.1